VVEIDSASHRIKDATRVHLEDGLVGLDSHGCRLLGDGSLELINGFGFDVVVVRHIDLSLGGGSLALSVNALVGVVGFEFHAVLLGIEESVRLPSTVATVRSGITINELLFREGDEVTSLQEMSSFHGSGGGERPAGSALALVLDGGDGTLLGPVDGGLVGLGESHNILLGLLSLESEELLVLGIGPGGELVVSQSERVLLSVGLLDYGVLSGELLHSELELLLGSVRESVLSDVLVEGLLHLVGDGGLAGEEARVAKKVHHI